MAVLWCARANRNCQRWQGSAVTPVSIRCRYQPGYGVELLSDNVAALVVGVKSSEQLRCALAWLFGKESLATTLTVRNWCVKLASRRIQDFTGNLVLEVPVRTALVLYVARYPVLASQQVIECFGGHVAVACERVLVAFIWWPSQVVRELSNDITHERFRVSVLLDKQQAVKHHRLSLRK